MSKRNTITLMLTSGPGNQMFQYAAAYALAKKNNASLILNTSGFAYDKLRVYTMDAYDVIGTVENTLPRKKLFGDHEYREQHFHFDEKFFELQTPIRLRGYFQSWRYFGDYADDIRALFTWKRPLPPAVAAMAQKITSEPSAVALYVRRGDFLSPAYGGKFPTCDLSYYKKAIALLQEKCGDNCHFFLFSQDKDWLRENFAFLPHKTLVDCIERDEEDLHLMSLCKHNIIANSSYGWWSAWLNNNPDKTVIAPRQWFSDAELRRSNCCDLLPTDWILL